MKSPYSWKYSENILDIFCDLLLSELVLRRPPSFLKLWRRRADCQTIGGATVVDVFFVELRRI